MKLILRFIKPYWKLFTLTCILIIVDVAGALYIPALIAQMMNEGTAQSTLQDLYMTGIQIVIASVISGAGAILGAWSCSQLSSRVCKDIRDALYKKSLKLSIYDFKQFGTASITTRTTADITNIQTALISFIQMVLPVPAIFIIALILTFHLDTWAGFPLSDCLSSYIRRLLFTHLLKARKLSMPSGKASSLPESKAQPLSSHGMDWGRISCL
ncbi:ABC transporter transmembrane domain-containing protein [Sellimonas sp.]|uniref:ABC transporter transmembrane domain-containing protein n=1 Tax=Sellimonas sp. TaxID=2021466 RepID=UPI000B38DB80|nr:hypothetical protein B5F13_10695 [Drancourtella sp. An177]